MRSRLVLAGRTLSRRLQPLLPPGDPGITILAYHLVGAGTGSPVDVSSDTFEQQMRAISRSGCAITLREAVDIVERGEPIDRNRVVVTFDDAFDNFDRQALPILEGFGIPSTVFVPTDFVDGRAVAPLRGAEHLPPMSWDRLREVARGGLVELGSHSRSHPHLPGLSAQQLEREIAGSAEVIDQRTGFRPTAFCYPGGLWSSRLEPVVRGSYLAAVVGGGLKNRPGRARVERLHRVSIRADMPPALDVSIAASVVVEEWLADKIRLRRARKLEKRRPREAGTGSSRR